MNALPLRKPRTEDEVLAVLREIRDLLRADLRKREAVPALLGALQEVYGPARFTVNSVLQVVDEDLHGALAEAVAANVDLNLSARSRATALGALFSRLPEIETVAEQRPRIYKLNLPG